MDTFDSGRSTAVSLLRSALLFTVGSALILHEKGRAFRQHAFERGREAQDQGRKLVQEMRAERTQGLPEATERLETRFDLALDRLGIPTRSDVQDLNQRITELNRRIDEI